MYEKKIETPVKRVEEEKDEGFESRFGSGPIDIKREQAKTLTLLKIASVEHEGEEK